MTGDTLHVCHKCGGSWYEGQEHVCLPDNMTSCRRCGATCMDPDDPEKACPQCKGSGTMRKTEDNPAGPGVKRLAEAALAASPVPDKQGSAYMVVWDKVKSQEDIQRLELLRRCYPRRNRKERQTYKKLVLRLMKKGLLIPATDNLPT